MWTAFYYMFKFKYTKIEYTPGELEAKIHRELVRIWKIAVQAFIKAALENMSVDTGMSVASLQPLAAEVRLQSAIIESLRGFGPKKGHTHKSITDSRFDDNIGPYKSRALGHRLGQKAYELDFGSAADSTMRFRFEIVVFQHFLHEYGVRGDPAWDSLEEGRKAFLESFDTNWENYINKGIISRYLTGKELI